MNNIQPQTSFTGSFIIKNPSPKVKADIQALLNKKKIIFENFNSTPNTLYVLRNGNDKAIAEYILKNKIKFEYFPTISTKNRFDSEKPKNAVPILNTGLKDRIRTWTKLQAHFEPKPKPVKPAIEKISPLKTAIDATTKVLGINIDDCKIVTKNDAAMIIDSKGKVLATTSPSGKFGINYAIIEPKYSTETPKRYAISASGEILAQYSSESGIKQFLKNSAEAVKYYKKTKTGK